jgi:hypothetical protein
VDDEVLVRRAERWEVERGCDFGRHFS